MLKRKRISNGDEEMDKCGEKMISKYKKEFDKEVELTMFEH